MSIYQSKPYPTKIPRAPRKKPQLSDKVSLAPTTKCQSNEKTHALIEEKCDNIKYGKVSLLDAHKTQCRFVLDTPMVCGEPVIIGSSWCKHHYGIVFTPYSVAKAAAEESKKKRQMENWPERKKF